MVKFSHQLKFNSNPDWKEHYIHYAVLRKLCYEIARLEREAQAAGGAGALLVHAGSSRDYAEGDAAHEQPLLPGSAAQRSADAIATKEAELVAEMDKELADIIAFTLRKEAELVSQLEALDLEVHSLEKQQQQRGLAARRSLGQLPEESAFVLAATPRASPRASADLGAHEEPGFSGRTAPTTTPTRHTAGSLPGSGRLDALEAGHSPSLARSMPLTSRVDRIRLWSSFQVRWRHSSSSRRSRAAARALGADGRACTPRQPRQRAARTHARAHTQLRMLPACACPSPPPPAGHKKPAAQPLGPHHATGAAVPALH